MNVIPWDGLPVTRPGIYSNIPILTYHAQLTVAPSISSSGLRTIFSRSLAHYFNDSYMNPDREEREESAAFRVGRAAHHLLLGEANFSRYYIIRPAVLAGAAWQGQRTDCKVWLKDAAAAGLTVLSGAEVDNIRGMANSLAREPLVKAGILNGLIEHSMVWQDPDTGIWLKWRPDAIPTSTLDFSDLKCVADISSEALERSLGDYGYHMQAALGAMACRALLGREMSSFTLVCAEKAAPNCVQFVTLKPADIELGEKQIRASLLAFKRALETSVWPGPGGQQADARYIELKPWARSNIEFRLQQMEQEILV